ncbi:hypothetical protein GCM10027059_34520 [Myceligenerans halotolerans]
MAKTEVSELKQDALSLKSVWRPDFDVVGVGAINLDYIVGAGSAERGVAGQPLPARIARLMARRGRNVEPGTEHMVDGETVSEVLEETVSSSARSTVLGGSSFNAIQAISQTSLGLRLGYVGVSGRVPVLGMSAVKHLDSLGVDRSFVLQVDESFCGICFSYAEDGERTLLTHAGANTHMALHVRERFDALVEYLGRARVVHITSFLDDDTAAEITKLVRALRERSPETRISFDPGHVWTSNRTPDIDAIAARSDYLLFNHREFREFGGTGSTDDLETAGAILDRSGNERTTLIVKNPSGIQMFRRQPSSDTGRVPHGTRRVEEAFYSQVPLDGAEIQDATGAGDIFAAGLLTMLTSDSLQIELGSLLGMRLASHKLRHVGIQGTRFEEVTRDFLRALGQRHGSDRQGVFIAHGGRPEWLAVRSYLDEVLSVPVQWFEAKSWAGRTVTDAISQNLERCGFAVCVLTAEDLTPDGRRLARQNVVHEVGLFQGRYGLDRVVLLVEEGCDFVPTAAEARTITFPPGKIQSALYKLEVALRESGLVGGETVT